jgi:hypothetical protein
MGKEVEVRCRSERKRKADAGSQISMLDAGFRMLDPGANPFNMQHFNLETAVEREDNRR